MRMCLFGSHLPIAMFLSARLDGVRNMACALSVSADALVFEQDERCHGEELLLQFEAANQLPPNEHAIMWGVLVILIIKHQTRRWDVSRATAKAAVATRKAAPSKTLTKRAAHVAR